MDTEFKCMNTERTCMDNKFNVHRYCNHGIGIRRKPLEPPCCFFSFDSEKENVILCINI